MKELSVLTLTRINSPIVFCCLSLFVGVCGQQAFKTEPRNVTVRAGATVLLKCEVLRASGAVQWVKDGLLLGPQRSLPGYPRYSMTGDQQKGENSEGWKEWHAVIKNKRLRVAEMFVDMLLDVRERATVPKEHENVKLFSKQIEWKIIQYTL